MSVRPFRSLLLAIVLASAGCAVPTSSPAADDAAEDDLTAAQVAGAFQKWSPHKAEGEISQLLLRPDKTFFMLLQGEFGCDVYAGYSCPASWSDGRTGDTIVRGTWKAASRGVVLQPAGEGRPSAPIPMTIAISKAGAKVEGTIVPHRRVFGDLDVVGLFGKPHAVHESDLDGEWTFTTAPDKDGDQPRLDGTNIYVGTQYTHFVTFRGAGAVKSYLEDRVEPGKKSRRRKDDGRYFVAGAPDGAGGPGIIVLDRDGLFDHVVITSFGDGEATFDVDPGESGRTLTAQKK
jgi:hypothetical protein